MEKSAVPKFSSFKPKPKKEAKPQEEEVRKDTSEDNHKDRDRRSEDQARRDRKSREHRGNRDDKSSRSHRHHDRESQDRSRHARHCIRERDIEHRVKKEKASNHSELDDRRVRHAHSNPDLEESDLFLVDRRGDSKNVEYGSLHRYSVPPYGRVGHGRVLGLDASFKMDREASTDKEISLMNVRKNREGGNVPRLLTSRHGRPKENQYRFIVANVPDKVAKDDDLERDYIDLRSSRKRKRDSDSPEPGVDYRSIEGKAKAGPADEDLTLDTDSEIDGFDHNRDLAARQQNAVLSKQTKAAPRDVQAWQALIAHQAKLVNPGNALSTFTSSERRTLADLRLSIVREAQANISKDTPGYEELVLAMIEEGRFVWDSSKRAQKWEDALQECPASVLLWTRYLNHVQDSSSGFQYETCKEAYMRCLAMLQKAAQKATEMQLRNIAAVQIYVLLRYTTFIREAGYIELSVAIWQALLEWTLRAPTALNESSIADRLSACEDFWDSDCPRFGEMDAPGWATYHANDSTCTRAPQTSNATKTASSTLAGVLSSETAWAKCLCLSTTADDDAAVEDPFRYVMFSDVRDVLECCDELESHRDLLVQAVLFFLGMPSLPAESIDGDVARHFSSWTRDAHLAQARHSQPSQFHGNQDAVRSRPMLETVNSLFDGTAFEVHPSAIGFVDYLLEQLLATKFDESLAEYLLAFRCRYFPETASKTAKQLLKAHPSSLRLYSAFALLQVSRKERQDLQKALQVWSTAINMRASLPEDKQDDVVLLWHSRLSCLARKTPDSRALLSSLMTICESSGDAKLQQLKVRRELEHGADRMLLAEKYCHAATYADQLAWLTYLTTEYSVEAALELYEKYARLLSNAASPIGLELLLQHKAQLLDLHVSHRRAYKPAVLRKEVDNDLQRFPSSSVLLSLRSRLSSQDRLREVINTSSTAAAATTPKSEHLDMVQWTHSLSNELNRVGDENASGVTVNTIRSVFSNAVSDPDSQIKHSPLLWELWLDWEFSLVHSVPAAAKEEAGRRTKQVLLDGMRHVPWHLGFVVRGMEMFADLQPTNRQREELRSWLDVLVERGLRVRSSLETAIE
ncbi:hypothetical protein CKM354_000999200 [Cercospora kikuchii]|uniref:Protein NRDE2-like protein n=1 Tax=Cercospora kikuchii TaxID=84275 RepID=A0A9P3CQJ5_9PEZI|nr:uncharacterized protein CKM354_000999200 [Cercospora kikuchii]GIZ46886.1 hypothetical protein CKM354_000999200 [Cercospora kikuchii]